MEAFARMLRSFCGLDACSPYALIGALSVGALIAVASADLCHMANTSYRLKRMLKFDEATRKYVGDEEANKMLTRNYRKPYIVPEKV